MQTVRIRDDFDSVKDIVNARNEQVVDVYLKTAIFDKVPVTAEGDPVDTKDIYRLIIGDNAYELTSIGLKSFFKRLDFPMAYMEKITFPLLKQNIEELMSKNADDLLYKARLVDGKITGVAPGKINIISLKSLIDVLQVDYNIIDFLSDGDTSAMRTQSTTKRLVRDVEYSFSKFLRISETWQSKIIMCPYIESADGSILLSHKLYNIAETYTANKSADVNIELLNNMFGYFDCVVEDLLKKSLINMASVVVDAFIKEKLLLKLHGLIKKGWFTDDWYNLKIKKYPIHAEDFNWEQIFQLMSEIAKGIDDLDMPFEALAWKTKAGNIIANFFDFDSLAFLKDKALLQLI